jgi:hypothetical protein
MVRVHWPSPPRPRLTLNLWLRGTSAPLFPGLPTATQFHIMDTVFTAVWFAELVVRGAVADSILKRATPNHPIPFALDPLTWCDVLAIAPFFLSMSDYWNDFATFKLILLFRTLKTLKLFRR